MHENREGSSLIQVMILSGAYEPLRGAHKLLVLSHVDIIILLTR